MTTLSVATKASPSLTYPPVLCVAYANELDPNVRIGLDYVDSDTLPAAQSEYVELKSSTGRAIHGFESIIADLKKRNQLQLAVSRSQLDEWLYRLPYFTSSDYKSLEGQLLELDAHLTLRSYIVGYSLTLADVSIWGAIRGSRPGASAIKKGSMVNLTRWFKFVEDSCPWIGSTIHAFNASNQEHKLARDSKGGSYDISLKNTEKGVVTRFPPEPSGYLHIGHAKAALLNDYFAHEAYPGGKLICRFDDTNPSKEREEFQDAIIEDLALMGIRPDQTSYSSDYFQEMHEYCLKMIKEGKAYADDTEQEQMRHERMEGIASQRRDETVEANLAAFSEMKAGSEEGVRWCIRAKMSVDNPNKAMRDPVIYRCNLTSHHRTGSTWKIYPTYDFCVPILDSLEGVTHALRTIEYRDRNPQYEWMQNALGLRPVHIWDFARMNFVRTLLSKRKLTKFVDIGKVWGWDDPRFPTIRGIRRRGMTIGALREFILKQGPSRNIVNLDWSIFWATNKKYIDPVSPRHTVVNEPSQVTCAIKGARVAPYTEDRPKHGKNPELGTKRVAYAPTIIIDQDDAKSFKQDEEITLMGWGNAIVRKISHSINPLNLGTVTSVDMDLNLAGDFKATEKKITWLATEGQNLIPVEMVDFDYLITKDKLEEEDNFEDFLTPTTEFRTKGLADENVAHLQKDDIIQFERKGYFRVDRPFKNAEPAVLFAIPTGKAGK